MKKLSKEQRTDRKRILKIIHKAKTSHIGSCLSAVDLISAVYKVKKPKEKFILSSGHSAIAWYAVLERLGMLKNPKLEDLHVHPDRNPALGIEASTGSLGHGLPIAVGMAFADRKKNVFCLISDGECHEGSIWEGIRVAGEHGLDNLRVIINANGYTAYSDFDPTVLKLRFQSFNCEVVEGDGHDIEQLSENLKTKTTGKPLVVLGFTQVEQFSFLVGLDAHYKIMSEDDYNQAMKELR